MRSGIILRSAIGFGLLFTSVALGQSQAGPALLNKPVDISPDFANFQNTLFVARRLAEFDPQTGRGMLMWQQSRLGTDFSFNDMRTRVEAVTRPGIFPTNEYDVNPTLPFSIDFVSPRTVRIRMQTSATVRPQPTSLMLVKEPGHDASWKASQIQGGYEFKSAFGSVVLLQNPWVVEIRDAAGRILTSTRAQPSNLPFSFIRRASDLSRSLAATFSLAADEKIVGCGESYTKLDKRGQSVVLWTNDVVSNESSLMYKPIPFFMSSRGYGMFMHTSSPITCDFGSKNVSTGTLYIGDDQLDLFIFLGSPKEILNEYTDLTGKAAMPPLWTFGLWMSRITYKSEAEVRTVAQKLRENRIPCDVIHLDTGWFQTDWHCDYKFDPVRFPTPQQMITDLKQQGFHISLWQLPYFVPKNPLFPEIVDQGLAVKNARGELPGDDAILDLSNPAAIAWYQQHLGDLLKMGVGAIKVDFGEAAPFDGQYASGRTGFYEHNLYPLRYQKAVAEITKKTTGDDIIWARAAWAGSQRYPIHWSGDSHNTDSAMAGTLRAGLSLGICGFSFWSHDIGGFFNRAPEELYRRWMPYGMLTSHSRTHGAPPREPWEYGEAFMNDFRAADELKYRLMPYVYAQAKDCTQRGLPMTRALFVEFPDDPGSWLVEDEYLFGSSILVAPLFEAQTTRRNVYLPPGQWIDYQTKKVYAGGWHKIEAGPIPIVMLVRDGTILPRIGLAQSTAEVDWSKLEMAIFATNSKPASGMVCLPADQKLREVSASLTGDAYRIAGNSLEGIAVTITRE